MRRARIWLAAAFLFAVLANLWPLDLVPPAYWPGHAMAMLRQTPDAGTLLALATWTIVGLLSAAAEPGRRWTMTLSLMAAPVLVEFAEIVAAGRHASLADGLLAGVAAVAAMRMGEPLRGVVDRLLAAAQRPALVAVAVLPPLLVLHAAGQRPFANWAPDFPVVIGREATQGEVWDGSVLHAAIYPVALDFQMSTALMNAGWGMEGRAQRRALGAILICSGSGAVLATRGCGTTPDLASAVQAAGAVTVELVAVSATAVQPNWPRLLTISPDPWRRNLTVGQQGDALYLRVRTPWSGTNALRQGLTLWGGVFAQPRPRHLLLGYDGHQVTAFVDGAPLASRILYQPRFGGGHDGPVGDATIAAITGAGAGALAGTMARPRRAAILAILPVLAALLGTTFFGGGAGSLALALVAGAACAGGLAAAGGLTRSPLREPI